MMIPSILAGFETQFIETAPQWLIFGLGTIWFTVAVIVPKIQNGNGKSKTNGETHIEEHIQEALAHQKLELKQDETLVAIRDMGSKLGGMLDKQERTNTLLEASIGLRPIEEVKKDV